jgi:hypothetical protein
MRVLIAGSKEAFLKALQYCMALRAHKAEVTSTGIRCNLCCQSFHSLESCWKGTNFNQENTMETYFNTSCPICERSLRVVIESLGQRIACRHCRGSFVAAERADRG